MLRRNRQLAADFSVPVSVSMPIAFAWRGALHNCDRTVLATIKFCFSSDYRGVTLLRHFQKIGIDELGSHAGGTRAKYCVQTAVIGFGA